jgi:hypothetical protein
VDCAPSIPLNERVKRLERENRRFKAFVLWAVAVLASIFLMGQARPANMIEAQRFVVVGVDGRTMAELGTAQDGLPYLWLIDRNGSLGATMAIASNDTGAGALISLGKTLGPEPESRLILRAYDDNKSPFIQAKNEFKQVIWSIP